MTADALEAEARWCDAVTAIELLAVAPTQVGGVLVRGWPGPVRDRLLDWVRMVCLPPLVKVPVHITDDRLLGGLSLAATLETGRVVLERGVLAQADGGVVLVPMAERLDPNVVGHLCAALDRHELALERDGFTGLTPCRIGVVALDEGLDDERAAPALADRLGLHVDLQPLPPRSTPPVSPDVDKVRAARARLESSSVPDALVTALCEAATQLGVDSLRATVLAVAVARVHAALCGRALANDDDAAMAARLVLGPRATRFPETEPAPAPPEPPEEQEQDQDQDQPPPPPQDQTDQRPDGEPDEGDLDAALTELVIAAAKSALPDGVLDLVTTSRSLQRGPRSAGRAGALKASSSGGRPAGTRAAVPQPGERLNVIETLRAAAPWQRLRRRAASTRVEVRRDDLRVTRFAQRTESLVIFCVDASGSAALQRLAEAKGAVEQVLGDCYVRRDHVALITFRGDRADLLLPPTRSLVRVRRCLADLAGGGATPIAAGVDAALSLALEARKRGRSPLVVMMTDGRANVRRDGTRGPAGQGDALASARALRAHQVRSLFIDTAPRPRPQARELAMEMGATYLPLPHLDPRVVSSQVQALTQAGP
jgi:magnesium chelatase subunit D